MASGVTKIAFCFFFVILQANGQVRLGEEVRSREEYPYQVFIQTYYWNVETIEEWTGGCGGVVVSWHFVLTAGHCVTSEKVVEGLGLYRRDSAVIFFGMLRRYFFKQHIQVVRNEDFMLHDHYGQLNFDIALIRTTERINVDNFEIARAVLGNQYNLSQGGWDCDVSGWGRSTPEEIRDGNYSQVLMSARNTIMGDQYINNEIRVIGEFSLHWMWPLGYNFVTKLYSYQTVFGKTFQKWIAPSPMHGDSGGPLSCYPRSRPFNYGQHKSVYGVLRGGPSGVGGGHGASVGYTRIAAHHEWIVRHVTLYGRERVLLDGRDAVMGQFPYQAAVFDRNINFRCSGVVVSKRFVLSGEGCFVRDGDIFAGEVDKTLILRNDKRQMRTCVRRVAPRNDLELCQVNMAFKFDKYVKKIDLAPEGLNPVDCQFASWDLNPADNEYYNYLTWKKANLNGYDQNGGHLDVNEVNLFPVDQEDRTSKGAGIVCGADGAGNADGAGGAVGGRYLVGMNIRDIRLHARFVNIREYAGWINQHTAELE